MTRAVVVRHPADVPAALAGAGPSDLLVGIGLDALVALRRARPNGSVRSFWSLPGAGALRDLLQQHLHHDYEAEFGADSPWHSAGYQLMQFEYEVAAALLAARALATQAGITGITLFAREGHAPIVGRPFLDPALETTAEEAVRVACAERSLPLEVVASKATPRDAPAGFAVGLPLHTRLRRRLSTWRARLRLSAILARRRPYILAYGELLDYINLVPQLEKAKDRAVVAVGQLSDQQLQTWLPRLPWGYLPLFEAVGNAGPASSEADTAILHKYLEERRRAWALPEGSPLIEVQRSEFGRAIIGGAAHIRRLAMRLRHHPPEAVLSANMSYWKTNFFLRHVGLGSRKVAFQHGGFGYAPPSCLYKGLEAVAVWGESQGELVRESGFTGAIIAESRHAAHETAFASDLPTELRVLLATSSQSNNSAPFFCDDEEYVGFLESLVRTVEGAPNLGLTIRNHPRFDHPAAYLPLVEGAKRCRLAGKESMEESIDNSSIVIFYGAFSTLLFEAARRGRRVAIIQSPTSLGYADRIATLGRIPVFESTQDFLRFLEAPTAACWERLASETRAFSRSYGTMPEATPDFPRWLASPSP